MHGAVDEWISDTELAASVGDVVAVPRVDPADSFVLHAPLELLARMALLPAVHPARRDEARDRIAEIAGRFKLFGEAVEAPRRVALGSPTDGVRSLARAIELGELDDVDALASWIGRTTPPAQLPGLLTDIVTPLLAAAGHAPIFLWLYPRVAPRREVTGELLRQLCRELARESRHRLRWIDSRPAIPPASGRRVFRALATTPRLGPADSDFIIPLMSRVDTVELAGELLGPLTGGVLIGDRTVALQRIAAWSMLTEPGDPAPYGWTHCLTMPQAVLETAWAATDPSRNLAVAATYVLGFRATHATAPIDERVASSWDDPGCTVADAIDSDPPTARAALWHLPVDRRRAAAAELATFAATHTDAHLVKYTLACFDAATRDPDGAKLYLTAAATLAGWWSQHPDGQALHS